MWPDVPFRLIRNGRIWPGAASPLGPPPEQSEDPERITIREALAFGKAVYDQRRALGLSVADLAGRAEMTPTRSSGSKRAAPSPPLPCCDAWPPHWMPTCA